MRVVRKYLFLIFACVYLSACTQLTAPTNFSHLDMSSTQKTAAVHNPTVNINGLDAEVWGGIATTLNNASDDLRPGFAMMYNQPDSWAQLARKTGTVGFFVESFAKPDIDVAKLAAVINAKGLKVETGPMGLSSFVCDGYKGQTGLSGSLVAAYELDVFGLQRWKDAGGNLDYLTLDDPINFILTDAYGSTPDQNCDYASLGWPNRDVFVTNLAKELAKWAVAMHKVFPNAKIGLTEMEGVYQVTGLDGTDFEPTHAFDFPVTSLQSIVSTVQAEFTNAGDHLDYFMVDFPSTEIAIDGANHPSGPYFVGVDNKGNAVQNNYGRVASAEKMVHGLGMKYNTYINEDPGDNVAGPNFPLNTLQDFQAYPSDANLSQAQWIVDRAENYLQDVVQHSIAYDAYAVELWSPLPKFALPESQPGTQMNVILDLVNQVWGYASVSNFVAQQAANQAALAQAAAQQAAQIAATASASQAVAAQAAAQAAAQQAAAAEAAAAQALAATTASDQASAAQIVNEDTANAQNSANAAANDTNVTDTSSVPAPPTLATVYRFLGRGGHHLYSLQPDGFSNGATLEGAAFAVYTQALANTVGLYRCSAGRETFLSVDAGCEGSTFIDQLGWIDTASSPTNAQLFRFDLRGDWLETVDANEGLSNGYRHQTLLGFAPTS